MTKSGESTVERRDGFRTTRDGVQQRTRTWVPAGDPRGVILLVHGIGEHSGRYERTGSLFAEAGLEARGFDLRGHGETGGTRMYVERFDHFLDDVEDLLTVARDDADRVFVLGHSMGGLIGARYAVSGRPQPDALVLSAPALDAAVPGWQRTAAPLLGRLLPKLSMATPIQRGQLSRDPAVEDAYFADPLVHTDSTTRLGAEVFRAMAETKERLARLRVPTFVLHGGKDELVPTRFSEPLATLPGVTRKVYPTLRHESLNEPEGPEVVADIVGWLDQLDES